MTLPDDLDDARSVGPGSNAELILVEGVSAARSVAIGKDDEWQAVLPMRGKVPNALDANDEAIVGHRECGQLFASLGTGRGTDVDMTLRRYDRVVLLCDADADGVHSRALLLLLFAHWLSPWLAEDRVFAARPPLYVIEFPDGDPVHAWSDRQRTEIVSEAATRGHAPIDIDRYKSIAGMNPDELAELTLAPETRTLAQLTMDHARAAEASYQQLRAKGARLRRAGRIKD